MRSLRSNQGSVFIVAMIFSAIVAIALGTYLNLALSAQKLANRSFFMNAAQNLADTGFERALWSLNHSMVPTFADPVNWTAGGFDNLGGNIHKATFPATGDYSLARGAKGRVKVWAKLYDATNFIWHTVALATVTLSDGSKINKYAECYMQQRSYSGGGMISRNGITFNGNVYCDSWISGGSSGANALYTASTHYANAHVASPALISLQNADIYGYAAIGTDSITSSSLTVGATGRLGNYGTANGVIDTTRVTYDFSASFADVLGTPTSGSALPAGVTSGGKTTVTLSTGTYYLSSLTLGGGGNPDSIVIPTGVDAKIVVTGNITMTGNVDISIAVGATSKLTMYVGGDFTMGGTATINNGSSANPNNPDQLTILGTRTEAAITAGTAYQDWTLQGGSFLSLTLYAPNANVSVGGNPEIYGSIVSNTVSLGGTASFHQDESLASKRLSGLYELLKWRDLATPSDRSNTVDFATWSTYLVP